MRQTKILVMAATAMAVLTASGQRQNTTRPKLQLQSPLTTSAQAMDTITDCQGMAVVRGYDKAQSATMESMFVTNASDAPIEAINITLTYYDMKGRQLHNRTETVACPASPGESVYVSIRAWDRQRKWHYHLTGGRPGSSTPYDVRIHLNYVVREK